jgi:hypothetical protein
MLVGGANELVRWTGGRSEEGGRGRLPKSV